MFPVAVVAVLLLVVGLIQVVTGIKYSRSWFRFVVVANGACAMGIPIGALLHNLVLALSAGRLEEPVFFLASVLFLPAMIALAPLPVWLLMRRVDASGKR